MRVASKLMVAGAVALGIVLPSTASASSPVVTHLFFDGSQSINTETGFSSTSNVSYGSKAHHGPNVGKAMIACTFLTDSTARCSGSIVIYKKGTLTPDKSVSFADEVLSFRSPALVIVIQTFTGDWGAAHSGFVVVHSVSDTANNVELRLVY